MMASKDSSVLFRKPDAIAYKMPSASFVAKVLNTNNKEQKSPFKFSWINAVLADILTDQTFTELELMHKLFDLTQEFETDAVRFDPFCKDKAIELIDEIKKCCNSKKHKR